MSDSFRLEVLRSFREENNRYTYFLLAATGAVIGFAIHQTETAHISISQVPLAVAIIFWGLSFFFGCRQLELNLAALSINAAMHTIQAGEHSMAGKNPQKIMIGVSTAREAFERASSQASRFAILQSKFFIGGAVVYIEWHILEMWLRTT